MVAAAEVEGGRYWNWCSEREGKAGLTRGLQAINVGGVRAAEVVHLVVEQNAWPREEKGH